MLRSIEPEAFYLLYGYVEREFTETFLWNNIKYLLFLRNIL